MARVQDGLEPGATAASDQLSIDAGLAEWVYHRAINDQGLSIGDISIDLRIVDLKNASILEGKMAEYGFTLASDGFVYNIGDGFTAAVVKDGANYTIVYRGTDVSDLGPVNGAAAAIVGRSSDEVDGLDVQQDTKLGLGTLAPVNQANDALNLARAVLVLANGDTSKVHVVGQSLGGGLAGVTAAVLGLSATVFAPAPFLLQVQAQAVGQALVESNIQDIDPSNYIASAERNDTGAVITVGDAVWRFDGPDAYSTFKDRYDDILYHYMNTINSNQFTVYRNNREVLTNTDDLVGWGINLAAQQFKPADATYEFGVVPNTDSCGSLHSQALLALEIRSLQQLGPSGEFADQRHRRCRPVPGGARFVTGKPCASTGVNTFAGDAFH